MVQSNPCFSMGQVGGSMENLKRLAEVKTLIRADKDLAHGEVVKLIGLLQAARITGLSVAVK